MDATLVPERILSLSECVGAVAPAAWAYYWTSSEPGSRAASLEALGLQEAVVGPLASWIDAALGAGQLGFPSTFFSLAKAQEFRARFFANHDDVYVVGLALDRALALRSALKSVGTAHDGPATMLAQDAAPEPGGRALGFDVLALDTGGFHSFLCGGAERRLFARLGARPNARGLFDDPTLARDCAALVEAEGLGEPGPWSAWEVLAYEQGQAGQLPIAP